ncbi:hypothetical protein I552_6098 [Mycobacterium xenopi 3993]|nr:hypothetical protein I552_6098 [Mycobacterium xenopi 3993]
MDAEPHPWCIAFDVNGFEGFLCLKGGTQSSDRVVEHRHDAVA